jgi:Holliday junction resolvase RusA-like endonuclease
MIPEFKTKILGEPVPQARVRATILGKIIGKQWIHFYTPKKSENYRDYVKSTLLGQGNLPKTILDQPLVASIKFYKTRPKSNKKPWLTTKPDLDNYLKQVKDAMSGIVYRDDSLIVGYTNTWKLYTNDNPRVEIALYDAFLFGERGEDGQEGIYNQTCC